MPQSVEQIYKKKDLHQHILDRPDTYIGSNKNIKDYQYVFDEESQKIIKKEVEFNPAFIKIFDEILVNAIDHTIRDSSTNVIKVNIDDDTISVMNNGAGIPVVIHKEHEVYIPELIFGQLLTSSNYDDTKQRIVGGLNGLGATVANIYSKKFIIETVDSVNQLYYYQEFSDNMYKKTQPIIKSSKKKSYTKISFLPDYRRFSMKGMTKDIESIIKKRTYDTAANTNKDVSVYFNDSKIPYKDFQQYISLYTESKVVYEKYVKDEFLWEYAVFYNKEANPSQVSFVNGIATYQGGKHVDFIMNQIIKQLTELLNSKKKIDNVKSSYIKDRLFIFVKATISNPSFSSQSKEYLSTPSKDFGSKPEVSENFINKIYSKTDIVEDLVSFTKYRNQKDLEKTVDVSSRKKSRLNIPKLEDAHNAGTSKSEKTVLFLTEGDSAKTFAMSGISVIGRDLYGVFALKGKGLNVREATQKQLLNNEELNNLKQIVGLQHNKKYTDVKSLRYGKICILTDADSDGAHIKGLLMNMFHFWWPELLEIKGFLTSMKTPMIKVKDNKGKSEIDFYTLSDYNKWVSDDKINTGKWNIKYYKGLGTSTPQEAKIIFKNMKNNIVNYFSDTKNNTDKSIILAFDKKYADKRKEWLKQYNFDTVLDQAERDTSYSDFVNKELIHFSMYDVIRSIPCICDGLKPSQRKVIFTMFKRNFNKEIKVAQLGAAVAELTSYHHGEASLFGTIINMAQDFPGSNNINLLKPNGQFGSRISVGKDAASPRYIFTELSEITKNIYIKEDFEILDYQEDDGQKIEPRFYVPILPMILINGGQGIGTGYSTNIPSFNPKDVISNMKRLINGEKTIAMTPWYKDYKGQITRDEERPQNFIMYGVYSIESSKSIRITEIPIGVGIDDYKEFLEKLNLKDVKNNSTETSPDFLITFESQEQREEFLNKDPYKSLKLVKSISGNNYHLLNDKGVVTKYDSAEEILFEFVKIRLLFNKKRKNHLVKKYSLELDILENKIKFLTYIMESKIVIYKKTKSQIEKILKENNFKTFSEINNDEVLTDDYAYLTGMPIFSFTDEKIQELNKKYDNIKKTLKEINEKTTKKMMMDDIEKVF